MTQTSPPRLFLVLGDQLHPDPHPLLSHASPHDFVLMAEVPDESTHVWSHRARTALFLWRCDISPSGIKRLAVLLTIGELERMRRPLYPRQWSLLVKAHPEIDTLCILEPGDVRVADDLQQCAHQLQRRFEQRPDPHFLCSVDDFQTWATTAAIKRVGVALRMEFFYRWNA